MHRIKTIRKQVSIFSSDDQKLLFEAKNLLENNHIPFRVKYLNLARGGYGVRTPALSHPLRGDFVELLVNREDVPKAQLVLRKMR